MSKYRKRNSWFRSRHVRLKSIEPPIKKLDPEIALIHQLVFIPVIYGQIITDPITPEIIKQTCLEIQATWDEATRRQRSNESYANYETKIIKEVDITSSSRKRGNG